MARNDDQFYSTENEPETGPWREYRMLVVSTLRELKNQIQDLNDKLDGKISAMERDLITLKVKAGIFGAAGGVVFGAIVSWALGKH